jgi:hypothetical protein
MASQIPSTWGQMRCVYAKNSSGWNGGVNNVVYPYGIYASSPSSVLFRLPLIARYIFQVQPIAEVGIDESYSLNRFFFGNSPSVGGLIPDKEWSYIKGKTVTTGGGTTITFAITDDAQFNYYGQTIESEETAFSVESIEGFTSF